MREVAVTGLGAVTPLGDAGETWAALLAGESGASRITRFDADAHPQCPEIACEVPTPPEHPAVDTREMGLYAQYAVAAAAEALGDAGLDPGASSWRPADVGVSIGTGTGGVPELEAAARGGAAGERLPVRLAPRTLPNLAAGHASIALDAAGPNRAPATACAAGAHAIADAADDIRLGRADVMVAGGTEAMLSPLGTGMFGAMRALGEHTDPAAASRPFDADRDGFVMGEGAGVLVLEARERAADRDAPVRAVLSGSGLAGDAHHPTAPHEEARGLVSATEMALADAGREPAAVDAVCAHATGTPRGDPHEARALHAVFEDVPPVTAPKSMLGHALGASGAIAAVVAVRALGADRLPPTTNYETPDPECDVPVVTGATDTSLDAVVGNAAGFGGTNGVLLFEAPGPRG